MSAQFLTPTGVILAAGFGSRYDPSGAENKLLAPLLRGEFAGRPVAYASASKLCGVLPRVIAVVRPQSPQLGEWLARAGCHVIESADARRGMGASLAAAIRADDALHRSVGPRPHGGANVVCGYVVALADMPWIAHDTIATITAALRDDTMIIAPVHRGQRGHPVAFGSAHAAALTTLNGDEGARRLLSTHPLTLLDVEDAGVLRDIDTPADLNR
jgi:molybdenum cofactor cytidylyltransferase